MRGGYYPCPPEAIRELIPRLIPPEKGPVSLLDPCAGEGTAIGQIAAGLGLDDRSVWMIELDPTRGEKCRASAPQAAAEGHILAPCSFLTSEVRWGSFSLVYCNPPFDDSLAQGVRVEEQFLTRVCHLITEGGILVFVCPEVTTKREKFRDTLLPWFQELQILPWPDKVRHYDECFVIARRRESVADPNERTWWRLTRGAPKHYRLPAAKGPGKRFTKTGFTDDELLEALESSPLHKKLVPAVEFQLPAPPLSLGVGHLALLLAAGQLDGLVCPPGEGRHVVRGVARKRAEITEQTVDKQKSQTVTKTTYTERIALVIRTVDSNGNITTLGADEDASKQDPHAAFANSSE